MLINAIPPDFHKPTWQYVHSEATQKLYPVQSNGLFNTLVSIVFGNEGHLPAGNVQNTLVCNSYPVCVLSQVFYYVFYACQGRFTIYYPSSVVCLLHLMAEQRQFILLSQGTFQAIEELALKSLTQLMDRIQIITRMSDIFPLFIKGIPGCRNNAVDMWM